ncbi:MAG: replicative DNA helicase [Bacilli bacterium]|jgi:replicative DNA helicase|nr:replicative DNA helicase [Bacilli bacterium]MCH4211118.1 replicative DNA helicase [Bacilli bacterium]MCH4228709.1 replicative DNA helicase [Bacilli bacterium]MCH4278113.1 replicative DNA helicase [Bacilli bacterium]
MAKITLPSNVEAERSVLGSMLMDPNAAAVGTVTLTEESFSGVDKRNVLVFKAMKELADHKEIIDSTSVINELTILKTIDDAGGADYIFELVSSTISPDQIDHYIKIVRDQAVLRDFLIELQNIQDSYANGGVSDISEFIASSSQKLEDIASKRQVGEFKDSSEVAKAVQLQIMSESNRGNRGLTGVDTGYPRLNQYTHGWQKGDLVIIAARPSVGKTAFALNLLVNGARYRDKPVAFFSCEMGAEQIMKRLISSDSLVNSESIQTGLLGEKDLEKIDRSVKRLSNTKIYIDDTANPMLGDLIAKARKLKAAHPDLAMIVIDYLNLISTESHFDSRANEVSLITKSLKELARSLLVPVIALTQLNRSVEQNVGRIPMLSNLKESGSIEQDADMVLLMYRKDYYKDIGVADEKPQGFAKNGYTQQLEENVEAQRAKVGKDPNSVSVVTFSVAKNRNGRTGSITLLFEKAHSRFTSPSLELEQIEAKKNGVNLEDFDEADLATPNKGED